VQVGFGHIHTTLNNFHVIDMERFVIIFAIRLCYLLIQKVWVRLDFRQQLQKLKGKSQLKGIPWSNNQDLSIGIFIYNRGNWVAMEKTLALPIAYILDGIF
jgi:hypothetical protein